MKDHGAEHEHGDDGDAAEEIERIVQGNATEEDQEPPGGKTYQGLPPNMVCKWIFQFEMISVADFGGFDCDFYYENFSFFLFSFSFLFLFLFLFLMCADPASHRAAHGHAADEGR